MVHRGRRVAHPASSAALTPSATTVFTSSRISATRCSSTISTEARYRSKAGIGSFFFASSTSSLLL